MNRKPRFSPVWAAVILTVVVRLLVGFSRADEIRLQCYTGNLALAFIEGLPMNPAEIPLLSHIRGSAVVGYMGVPFMLLFGTTMLSMKLLAAVISGATAGFFAHVLNRQVGALAGWCGAFLYALLPPPFLMRDSMPLGSHEDTILIIFAALALLCSFPRGRDAGPWRNLAFGVLSGFGIFFSFQYVVALPALLLAWFAIDRGFWRRKTLLFFVLGAAIGFSPTFYFASEFGQVASVVNKPLSSRLFVDGMDGFLGKVWRCLEFKLSAAWLFDVYGGAWARWSYGLGLLFGLGLLVGPIRRCNAAAVYFALQPVLMIGAYAALDFEISLELTVSGGGMRFLAPMVPAMAAWVAIGVQVLSDRGLKPVALVLGTAPLAAGLAGAMGVVDLQNMRAMPPVRATDYSQFQDHLKTAGGDSMAARLTWIDSVDKEWVAFRPMFHHAIELPRENWESWGEAREDLAKILAEPKPLRDFLCVAFGRALAFDEDRDQRQFKLETLFPRLPDLADDVPPEDLAWIMRGVGLRWMKARAGTRVGRVDPEVINVLEIGEKRERERSPFLALPLLAKLPPQLAGWAAEGLGFWIGKGYSDYSTHSQELLQDIHNLPGQTALPLWTAFGWGYRMRFSEERYREPGPLRVEDKLSEHERKAFRRGLNWGDRP